MLRRSALSLLLPLLAAAGLLACSPGSGSRTADESDGSKVVARLAGEEITAQELDEWIKDELFRQQTNDRDPSKLHEVRSEALRNLLTQRILEAEAEAQGVTPQELVTRETQGAEAVRDEDVRAFYERHQQQLGGASFEQAEPRIRQHLAQQAQGRRASALIEALRDQYDVEILLETPRVEVAADGPAKGPADAPVTIVEFSDYECPYCRRAEPTVKALRERYPDQVRFVYRHFPLDNVHPRARAAAEAAVCAHRQEKFWELHEILFTEEDYEEADLRTYAEQAGLDLEAYEACRQDPATQQKVQEDLMAGREVGVTGTPAFFVNGMPLRGARPLDEFVELVEQELQARGGAEGSEEAQEEDA